MSRTPGRDIAREWNSGSSSRLVTLWLAVSRPTLVSDRYRARIYTVHIHVHTVRHRMYTLNARGEGRLLRREWRECAAAVALAHACYQSPVTAVNLKTTLE